jgi:hypothetical protein
MKKLAFLLLFLSIGTAFAQNVRVDGDVKARSGAPAPNSLVAICTQPAVTSTSPCSPLAPICSSPSDAVCSQPNPVLADGLGNYFFYLLPGTYTRQFYGSGLTARVQPDQTFGISNGIISNSCVVNSSYVAGSSCYATINVALTAAGTTGSVLIPAGYAGTDSITNTNNVPIIDLRGGNTELRIWSALAPVKRVTGYPEGSDLPLRVRGPADLWLEHENAATTTAASLSVGANASILIGSVVVGNNRLTEDTGTSSLFSPNAGLIIGRDTANEEFVGSGSWSIVNGTHLSITCANTHAGTTDIEQIGSTLLTSYDLFINSAAVKATNNGLSSGPLRIKDQSGNLMLYIPTFTGDSFPYSTFQWGIQQTGINGANKNYLIRNFASNSQFQILKSSTAAVVFSVDDLGNSYSLGGSSASAFFSNTVNTAVTGVIRLASTDTDCWRNNANSSDVCISKNASDQVVLPSAIIGSGSTKSISSGTASNTDLNGELTMSGGTLTYTFTGTYTSHPTCVASDETAIAAVKVTYTGSTAAIFTTSGATDVVSYICLGRN